MTNPNFLNKIGGYASNNGAEIPAFDPVSDRLFVVAGPVVEVLDFSNPVNLSKIGDLAFNTGGDPDGDTPDGFELVPNSVAVGKAGTVSEGIVAVAIAITNQDTADDNPGEVQFFNAADGAYLGKVNVGYLPDMLAFTPDGTKILTANEGQPNDAYTNDPVGSVSVIDLSGGVRAATVQEASFEPFNSQKAELIAAGVRIFGPGASVAQDLEPEYITFNEDGTKAWVTLQENNAIAVVDIATATVESILPLGYKDHNGVGVTNLETFEFGELPTIGTTDAGQELFLGGFSGLFYEGTSANGNLKFVTNTDRGPNGEATAGNRPFLLPDFSPEIVRFELNRTTSQIFITERITIKQANGTPITGLPNLLVDSGTGSTPYNDENPVDLNGNDISPLDPFGGDLEGIVVNPTDSTFWMVDEYRPAIYHFATDGTLIDRFVPEGTAAAAGQPDGTFGIEALPAVLAQRRQNRGFEAVALNTDNGKLYAFVQSPIRNPETLSNGNLNGLNNIRIVEFDVATETVTAEYLYRMDNPDLGTPGNSRPDKIGDAVYIGNGEFLVVERDDDAIDSDPLSNIEKKVYRFNLGAATNILGQDDPIDLGGGVLKTVDQMTPEELASQGIFLVNKLLHVDLAQAGYNAVEKVEGLAPIDANTIAVINDNDFQVAGITLNGDGSFIPDPDPEPVVLGLITTEPSNSLDPSDRDVDGTSGGGGKINIQNWPVLGMYQPDSIASFTANGQTYYVTANEGDARDYAGFSEEIDLGDITLDPAAFPNATELALNQNLGRLTLTSTPGDTDGDGDYDRLYAFGARSFSIWDSNGTLVYDSGDDFEQITAAAFPDNFNSNNDSNNFDNRSDNKGPEPEGVTVGTIGDRTYAFVGLERIGGMMVYEVTNPEKPAFVQYLNTRDFTVEPEPPDGQVGLTDSGPEGLTFIPASDSPNGDPLLVVANEVSKTVAVYRVDVGTRISDIQGSSDTSPLVGQSVSDVPGIVTAIRSNGFYLQDPSADDNPNTSEGIFVFTSSAPTVAVGDAVTVSGTVGEFFGLTQITGSPSITIQSSGNPLPEAVQISLPSLQQSDLEAYEGMRFELVSSGAEPLVIIENFNLDRFGEITVAEGNQTQPTQILDPDTQLADIQALIGQNLNERLLLDDGSNAQNPTEFPYLPANVGDNGNGFLDAGDTFSVEGPTVRLGAEVSEVQGVLSFGFSEYRLLVDETISIDLATNEGARPASAPAVGGDLKVASFNVLNYFTTLDDGSLTGPNGDLEPRGANTANELERQTAKLVAALAELNPDVIGLQELENNGTIAINTLVDSLNAFLGATIYDFVDPTGNGGFIGTDAITTGLIYKPGAVSVVTSDVLVFEEASAATTFALADVLNPFVDAGDRLGDFQRNRPAVAATFETTDGEQFTVAVNHFKSKGDSNLVALAEAAQDRLDGGAKGFTQADIDALLADPNYDQGDGQGFWNQVRADAAAELSAWLTDTSENGYANGTVTDPDVLIIGDLNAYALEDPLDAIKGAGYDDLIDTFAPGGQAEAYSFVFDGQRGSLDHALSTGSLSGQVTGVAEWHINADEPDLLNYDESFNDPAFYDDNLFGASDHDPLLVGLELASASSNFTLQILHASDLEGGVDAIGRAANFAAIVDILEDEVANSVLISSGDNYIPGPFFNAAADISLRDDLRAAYQTLFNDPGLTNVREGGGRVDISIMNILGFDASAIGNHEFDLGPDAFAGIIGTDIRDGNGDWVLDDVRWLGAQFPYLSSNLDFSGDGSLSGLFTSDILPNTVFQSTPDNLAAAAAAPKLAPATVIEEGGELIGVVGATTQLIESITTNGAVSETTGKVNDMAALAAALQPVIDDLIDGADNTPGTEDDINKIVLTSHLQQLALEQELAGLLSGVDVILAGGSDTLLADSQDTLRPGDTAAGDYPFLTTNADGNSVAIVSTDGEYSYVGRLVVEFDASGNVIPGSIDPNVSGVFATTDDVVLDVTGAVDIDAAIANSTKATEVQKLTDAVSEVVVAQDGNVFGQTEVFIDGRRESVRTEETNMGNLTADANLAAAQAIDSTVVVSLKNGGGIRAPIGEIDSEGNLLPPQANPVSGKLEGQISQLDIDNTLRFNNGLTLLTLTAQELVAVIEHGVAATEEGATPGQFPQVSGLAFSFDPDLAAGSRVQSLAIENPDGTDVDVLVEGGQLRGDPTRTFRIVTLNFLADGGDGYPFPTGPDANRVDLYDLDGDGQSDNAFTGEAKFAANGTEQDALAEYLVANFPADSDPTTPAFSAAETAPDFDERIQNLNFREDGVLGDPDPITGLFFIKGTPSNDTLISNIGTQIIETKAGRDTIVYDRISDAYDIVKDFEVGQDELDVSQLLVRLGITSSDPFAGGYVGATSTLFGDDARVFVDLNGDRFGGRIYLVRLSGVNAADIDASSFVV